MKRRQYIKYENYKNHKIEYGHIATWALWNEDVLKLEVSQSNNDYYLRKDLLIADSEEEYRKKNLNNLLHGDVVILGLNMSCPEKKPSTPNALLSVLNENRAKEDNRVRYDKLIKLGKDNDLFTFSNMYRDAGRGRQEGSGYAKEFMKSEILNGAYMTDFVKFVEDEGEIIPAAIPESNSADKAVKSRLLKGNVHIQTKGLKKELDLLKIKPKVFILAHSSLNNSDVVKNAISQEFGYKPHFEYLYHYSPQGKQGFSTYEEMYAENIKKIIENIESKI